MKIAVNMLEHSPRVNVRGGLDKATVARYVEAYESGEVFGPILVFREPGTERYVIADGAHRTEAAKQAGVTEIEADVRDGDETDALKIALSCNAKHGLLRRDSDVQACIKSLMLDPVLSGQYKTHQERAELLGMSYKTFQRHFAKWRQSKGGTREERALKSEMQEKAEASTTDRSHGKDEEKSSEVVTCPPPDEWDHHAETTREPPARKPREKKPELTPAQKKVAKEMAEAAKRDRLDAANRKNFVEALDAIRVIPHSGTIAGTKWDDIEAPHVAYVRDWCDEFLKARRAKAA